MLRQRDAQDFIHACSPAPTLAVAAPTPAIAAPSPSALRLVASSLDQRGAASPPSASGPPIRGQSPLLSSRSGEGGLDPGGGWPVPEDDSGAGTGGGHDRAQDEAARAQKVAAWAWEAIAAMVPRCRDVAAQAQHQQAAAWAREGAGGSSSKEDEATAAAVTTAHNDECSAVDPPKVNIHYNVSKFCSREQVAYICARL
ncbi:uncharacterized protein [Miscanthus floridulus]|uniref:uncharacterized protein n=1 Tax=Miscanthus floridulus TaxID=154761 RepID=UPI00345ABA04